ncbi:MAG: DUF87 domain-containing protein [Ancrocorticia sp.]
MADIDYLLAPGVIQEQVMGQYAQFLNGHLGGQHLQFVIHNEVRGKEEILDDVSFPMRGDGYDRARSEYNDLIAQRLESGRKNTQSEMSLTLTIEADSLEEAKATIARVVSEDVAGLADVGECRATEMSGEDRVRMLQRMLRPGSPATFQYRDLLGQRLTTKDFVAPMAIDTKQSSDFVVLTAGKDRYVQTMILRNLPAFVNDRVLADLAGIPIDLTISLHFDPMDQEEGRELVKKQLAAMDMQRLDSHKKAVKQKLDDEDVMPHELTTSLAEGKELLAQLEGSNQKMFTTRILVGVAASSREELAQRVKQVRQVCGRHSCSLEKLRFMQLKGLNALLPLGACDLPVSRALTTSEIAVMVPFTTQELFQPDGFFYGINPLSKNPIFADRRTGMNSNGFILGTSGSGKSQLAKCEMVQTYLKRPNDEVLVVDPEHEYAPLVEELGGTRVKISAGSQDCINPLFLEKGLRVSDGDPVRDKCAFVRSLCEVLLGGVEGLTALQRSVIDRVTLRMYREYMASDAAEAPTLKSLYEALREQPEVEAAEIAAGLELYATGSAAGFAQPTNVDTSNRFTVYDISELGDDLQTFGMMVVLEDVWGRVARNRARGVRTALYIDEFHMLFDNAFAASYLETIYARIRKWGGGVTGMTQNIERMLGNEKARRMLSNSDCVFLLQQEANDAQALEGLFRLSHQQRGYFTNQSPGRGLLKFGSVVIPFDNTMDTNSHLYQLFSTKFEDQ